MFKINVESLFIDDYYDSIYWARENFGEEEFYKSEHIDRWCYNGNDFYFKNKNDAMLFKLIWGGI